MTARTVGVTGAGSMARTHVEAWRKLGLDVVVWSPNTAKAFAAQHGVRAAESLVDLLQQASLLDITSPTVFHAEQVRAAIAAGLPIICEKPLALSSDVARDLVVSAAEANVPLFPAHVVRYMSPYARAHNAVSAGELGQISSARFVREAATPAGGTWFDDDAVSGGILIDFLIHDYDQARWMLGDVTRVQAEQTPPTVDGVVPAEVEARITLTHAGGAVSDVSGRWAADGNPFRSAFRIEGSDGDLEHDSSEPGGAQPVVGDPYSEQLADFLRALDGGSPARVNASDGFAAVRIAEAAHRSAASGHPVGLA